MYEPAGQYFDETRVCARIVARIRPIHMTGEKGEMDGFY